MSRKARYNQVKGDYVLIKNIRRNSKLQSIWENEVYKVIKEYPSSVKITKITNKDKTFIRHKTHVKKYKGNIPVIQTTSKPIQQRNPQLPSSPYITLLLEPDYPQIDNHDAESDTDSSVDTNDTGPYAEIEPEIRMGVHSSCL